MKNEISDYLRMIDDADNAHSPTSRAAYADALIDVLRDIFTDEEIQALAQAKADGRLVELPCKVGDLIYWFWTDSEGNPEGDIEEESILYFYIDKDGVGIATKHYDGHIGHYTKDGELVDDVRRIYLSREAAENAIAEVMGE